MTKARIKAGSSTRRQRQGITRSKLVDMGRKHFLAKGFAGTSLEQVAADAGFTRGAIYSNFSGKEDLFLSVFSEELSMGPAETHDTLDRETHSNTPFGLLRQTFVDQVCDRAGSAVQTEFAVGALHCETLRKHFLQLHHRDVENAVVLSPRPVGAGDLELQASIDDLVTLMQSFVIGLAVEQQLLKCDLPASKLRTFAESIFDCLTSGLLQR